jgi:hypothetical protein
VVVLVVVVDLANSQAKTWPVKVVKHVVPGHTVLIYNLNVLSASKFVEGNLCEAVHEV